MGLAGQGWTQRRIAAELKCSQPTVCRGIDRYRRWFGSTLPEDRGEMTGFARFRVAQEEHRVFLEHQKELAMEEWERTRQSVPVKKTRTKIYPEGRKHDGDPVTEVVIEEYEKFQAARVLHFNAATKLSLVLTILHGGYLGPVRMNCDKLIDADERDRWDRAVKERDATIEELKRKVAELESGVGFQVLGAGLPTPPTGPTEGLPAAHGDLRSGVSAGSETRAEPEFRAGWKPTPLRASPSRSVIAGTTSTARRPSTITA